MNQRLEGRQRGRKAQVEDPRLAEREAEIERLRADVSRLTEENRAFVCSVRHMTGAAEEVLAEARREASETRARAAAEAYERLVVARADARAAVHEERQRAAAELELLAAVRERIQQERSTLSVFQDELSGRLRDLVSAVFDFEEHTPALGAGPSWDAPVATSGPDVPVAAPEPAVGGGAATMRTESEPGDRRLRSELAAEPLDRPREDATVAGPQHQVAPERHVAPERFLDTVVVEAEDTDVLTVDPGEEAEEELEAAFAAFFHADIEGEPSRHWILDGR